MRPSPPGASPGASPHLPHQTPSPLAGPPGPPHPAAGGPHPAGAPPVPGPVPGMPGGPSPLPGMPGGPSPNQMMSHPGQVSTLCFTQNLSFDLDSDFQLTNWLQRCKIKRAVSKPIHELPICQTFPKRKKELGWFWPLSSQLVQLKIRIQAKGLPCWGPFICQRCWWILSYGRVYEWSVV